MDIEKFQIKNFKCFDDEGCTIENIKSINIIIGKNNTGKSSLIEVFKFLTNGDRGFFESKRNGKLPELLFHHRMKEDMIGTSFASGISGGEIGGDHYEYGLKFINSNLIYRLNANNHREFVSIDREFKHEALRYFNSYVGLLVTPLQNKLFSHLSAERDILPELPNAHLNLSTTGIGATNIIQQILNRDVHDSDLIEKTLLVELNKIINPDIAFSRILVQQNDQNIWEIYFENNEDGRIPLSKMGSGIKTVLLVLILLFVKPVIDKRKIYDYVFAFEELENNLHPSMQRRLYYYLFDFSQKNNCIFFFTTHSNIVIDLYNSLSETQIFHINKIQGRTRITSIIKQSEFKRILDDLDVRASDILQCNGIIWVEGPSDRIYLNKWISLIDNSLIEGYHYSIMFYGGRLLSNLPFNYEFINTELIPLLKLNTNAFVVMDRDGKTISVKLNDTKLRIQKELGNENVWITKGREIENYLSEDTIKNWLSKNYNLIIDFNCDPDMKIEEIIYKLDPTKKFNYSQNKNKYASEIETYIKVSDLERLNLKSSIVKLVKEIRKWNKL